MLKIKNDFQEKPKVFSPLFIINTTIIHSSQIRVNIDAALTCLTLQNISIIYVLLTIVFLIL